MEDAVGVDVHSRTTVAGQHGCAKRVTVPLILLGAVVTVAITTILAFATINHLVRIHGVVINNGEETPHVEGESESDAVSSSASSSFTAQVDCFSGWSSCTSPSWPTNWCCPSDYTCGSAAGDCIDGGSGGFDRDAQIAVIVIASVFGGLLLGPAILYGIFIGCVRCNQCGEFDELRLSNQHSSFVIISGCFDMSIAASAGDPEFIQAAYAQTSGYGGCKQEFIWHCLGFWLCGACYPFCMCCVTAEHNRTKKQQLEFGLSLRGYSAEARFASNVIPVCCNSIFIGQLRSNQNQRQSSVRASYNTEVGYGYVANGGGYQQVSENNIIPPAYSQSRFHSGSEYSHQYSPAPVFASAEGQSPTRRAVMVRGNLIYVDA